MQTFRTFNSPLGLTIVKEKLAAKGLYVDFSIITTQLMSWDMSEFLVDPSIQKCVPKSNYRGLGISSLFIQ